MDRINKSINKSGRSLKSYSSKDIVKEASTISHLVKDAFRQKMSSQIKTPGKNKTPSKFTVFQDGENDENQKNCDGESILLKSSKKKDNRFVLQPKSMNTSAHDNIGKEKKKSNVDEVSMMKQKIKQNKSTETTQMKPTPQSILKNKELEDEVEMEMKEQELVEYGDPNDECSMSANEDIVEGQNMGIESKINDEAIAKDDSTEETKTNNDTTQEESKLQGRHCKVIQEEEELLSLGSSVSESMIANEESLQNHGLERELLDVKSPSMYNKLSVPSSIHECEHDDNNDYHSTASSIQTPNSIQTPDSVQTFSIGGRSYSLDVSTNVLKGIFHSPIGNVSNHILDRQSPNSQHSSDDTEYQDISVHSENYLHDVISPKSKAIFAAASEATNGGISKSSAASLLARNKTLIKEVRFADQTCIELSERNAGMHRDVNRLETHVEDLKTKNDSLHDFLLKSKQENAKMEANNDHLKIQIIEQSKQWQKQLRSLEEALAGAKNHNQTLVQQLDESNALKLSIEKQLVASLAKSETLQASHSEEKEKVSTLMARLVTSQSSAEVTAASAAESYRSFCQESQTKIESLKILAEERLHMFKDAENDCLELEKEKKELIKCLEEQKMNIENSNMKTHSLEDRTPLKVGVVADNEQSPAQSKTPTTSVLARTLEAELQKGYDATERILEAEMIISVTQSELKETSTQLQLARSEIDRLNVQVHHLSINNPRISNKIDMVNEDEPSIHEEYENNSIGESSFETGSTDELIEQVLSQKLTNARSECEVYKRDLETILNEIKGLQGESFLSITGMQDGSNEQTIAGLLQAVRELAQVATRQANELSGLKTNDVEKKKKFEQLKSLIDEREKNILSQKELIEQLKSKM